MSVLRLAERLAAVRRDESGQAIVMVLAVIVIALVIGAAGLADAISSGKLASYDQRAHRAQQAADAGVQQQLYDQSESDAAADYNFTGGVLGLGTFLDCSVPQETVSGQIDGITAYASSAGICPQGFSAGGGAVTNWTALDNHDYYQSELLTNKEEEGGSGLGGAGAVLEFPEVVSAGCDTLSAGSCLQGSSSNVYSRELAVLAPTGPEQAVEAVNNVQINSLSALGLGIGTINGDVVAGNNLTLPTLTLAVNTALNVTTTPPTNVTATLAYGGSISPNPPLTTAHVVHLTGGACAAGEPSTTCFIKRPPLTVTTTTCAACSAGITASGTGGAVYNAANDTFTMTKGTVQFAPGDYVFCNFNATGGTIDAPYASSGNPSGPVRIFILAPNQAPCSGYGLSQTGDFTASQGITNGLAGTVNGVSGAVDPSGFQVYVVGDGAYDGNTTVNIGDSDTCTSMVLGVCKSATAPAEYAVVYAPTSTITLNTGTCVVGSLGACSLGVAGAFEGALSGYNVNITAAAISQDLDIANDPLYTGINAYRVTQYVQCDNSVENLAGAGTDTGGC
jgi:Tfp pilus assembly protein PilX